ncbi:MAG: L-serine ammonia-lyase [Desulforhopalus sp.]
MFISVADIFKIGIGPSSSHTMGPMTGASLFLAALKDTGTRPHKLRATLYGSLAYTGKGHATDRAVILGLAGYVPESIDSFKIGEIINRINKEKIVAPEGFSAMNFDPSKDLIFDYGPPLEGHANGMRFFAYNENEEEIYSETYYSIGGGFVVLEKELLRDTPREDDEHHNDIPYPFSSASEMLKLGREQNLSIWEMKRANELVRRSDADLNAFLDRVWSVMADCIDRGLKGEGILPGGLRIKRRAKPLYEKLQAEISSPNRPPHYINEWLSLYAIAVNEENSNGGVVVTAPTNGAAGVIPSVINYYLNFCPGAKITDVRNFLLVAAAIGGIVKHNASISGAEVGCQGEVGSAAAMAAAGLCSVLGGSNEQIENGAEIALEHHLGMTCDPINGLVQVPCIERNGIGAVKAVTAAALALQGDGSHFVSLDSCIKTMYDTGLDMNSKYKETAQGGLAVNWVEC